MSFLTVDSALQATLAGLKYKTEVRDADGNILGYYTPREVEIELLYKLAEREFSADEMRRRLRDENGQGRPLKEILRDLEARKPQ